MGLVVGWLVNRLARETELAEQRAGEAEGFRDELGRRVDVLDAANRCARALGSSLDLDQAFAAFIRELRGLLGFDRTAIVLADDGTARVMAAAGRRCRHRLPDRDASRGCRVGSRGGADRRATRLPARHAGRRLPGRACVRRARPALPSCRAAPRRRSSDRNDLDRSGRARLLQRGGDRARVPARPLPRFDRSEHPRVTKRRRRPSRSCGGSRPCAPTSSRSSRTSSGARWRP